MSREPIRPILAKDTDRRLAAIIRRGGKGAASESDHRLPNPPRGECQGQLALGLDND
jgi:hypothetical protein